MSVAPRVSLEGAAGGKEEMPGGGTRSAAALSHGLCAYRPAWEQGNSIQLSAWCSELMTEPVSHGAPLWPSAEANGGKLGAQLPTRPLGALC
jgi:hypothetical protein